MRLRTCIVALALSASAAAALAAETITEPSWLKRPSAEQLMQVLPRAAQRGVNNGRATIECTVTVQGALRACKVIAEDPAGKGFGDAALLLAPYFLMRPAVKDGKPVEGTVRIPIAWKGDFSDLVPSGAAPTGSLLKPEPNSIRMVGRLPWQEAPSVADVLAAYPQKARAGKAGGRVVLDCVVKPNGRLGECRSVAETPGGYGFAGAARALSSKFLAPTATREGESLAGVHTQVKFIFDPQSLDSTSPVIGKPDWTALPGPDEFARAFPAKASAGGVLQARVVLGCTVGPGGALKDCAVESEDPAGYGFGEGAVALSRKFRLNPWTAEGLPAVGGTVRVPLRYDLKQAPQPPPTSP